MWSPRILDLEPETLVLERSGNEGHRDKMALCPKSPQLPAYLAVTMHQHSCSLGLLLNPVI
jgi:hypothetical protein